MDAEQAHTAQARVVLITLDRHLDRAVSRAATRLRRDAPGVTFEMHAAVEWGRDAGALERARAAIAEADVLLVTMLFLEDHIQAVLGDLKAARARGVAVFAALAAGEVVKLTKLGRFDMGAKSNGVVGLLKKLRGGAKKPGGAATKDSGAKQMAMLKRLPKILRFVPGTAQDVRAYFIMMQYWVSGSPGNIEAMVRYVLDRFHPAYKGALPAPPPEERPETGVYHPQLPERFAERREDLPATPRGRGVVGVLLMRSYLMSGDSGHYDGVIAALEAQGLSVVPAYASGLDARPAIEKFFMENGRATVDAVVSLTGFSLVGGPAFNDADAAADILGRLDVPYVAAHALEFQTLDRWRAEARGLSPIEATMMVAIPELDGAIAPQVYGGRAENCGACPQRRENEACGRCMRADPERAARLAERVAKLIALRRAPAAERRIAVTLFNFPPNSGASGTAAFLDVFASLANTLRAMRDAGYDVGDAPLTADALREAVLGSAAEQRERDGRIAARILADDHVRREPHLGEIEAQWGPAPGRHQTDGAALLVLGARFGNVFVGLQPGFGYEGDPMRLLFERGFAPTHAFSAYYRWLREDFGAHAHLHFGTHGALEFMPGAQTGLTGACWPERLIGETPNIYLYAANNPSEGAIAKRRAAATLVSYLTPPLSEAGLYRGLVDLKASLERHRAAPPEALEERRRLAELIQAQAAAVDLADAEPAWVDADAATVKLAADLIELEHALIPDGLHVLGETPSLDARAGMLRAMSEVDGDALSEPEALRVATGAAAKDDDPRARRLSDAAAMLAQDAETPGLLRALDGRFVPPSPGGDLLRSPQILPTGRNIHGFDPFRMPSAFAVADGARQAERLLERHRDSAGGAWPRTVAIVLWGSDNLKSEGAQAAQAMALMGARPRFDGYGRLVGAELIDLEPLGRPRIDVLATLSGIFRDLLPLQTKMLAEAALLAASADEPVERNFVRAHALAYQAAHDVDLETAALRVFSNADGAYGSNVNQLIDSGAWDDEDELADAYQARKCFAYGRDGAAAAQPKLLDSALATVDVAYQNLESVELGVTTIDHYFDTLGGVTRAVKRARGEEAAVYIGDQTRGEGKIRTLSEQVALETRTRTLNPKWYEAMLRHGYEGVRQIEAQVTNTLGWSATTGQVDGWVYREISATFVLDEEMRRRLAELNPKASARVAHRLLEASDRAYWTPDEATLEALRRAGDELDDIMEGAPTAAPSAQKPAPRHEDVVV